MNQEQRKQVCEKVEACGYIVKQLLVASIRLTKEAKENSLVIAPEMIFSAMVGVFTSLEETPEK